MKKRTTKQSNKARISGAPRPRVYLDSTMPRKYLGDAWHLAYATFHKFEFLLTWNCNHLANANKRRHLETINWRLGFETPEIVTPLELFKEKEDL